MLPLDPSKLTCGVVIEKNNGTEKVCPARAVTSISIANPEDMSQIVAIVILCERHEKELDNGKALIFLGENGEHIAVQYEKVQE